MGKKVKLIIVCDEKTRVYANYLRQLISVCDDKDGEVVGVEDGTVEAVVWLEKDYEANYATVSSSEHILFIGNNKTAKSEATCMEMKFNMFGMQYGWLGKRAVLRVTKDNLTDEEYAGFLTLCSSYEKEFNEVKRIGFLKKKKDKLCIEEKGTDVVVVDDEEKKKTGVKAVALAAAQGALAIVSPLAVVATDAAAVATSIVAKNAVGNREIRNQQYNAATAILYMDGLAQFLEG